MEDFAPIYIEIATKKSNEFVSVEFANVGCIFQKLEEGKLKTNIVLKNPSVTMTLTGPMGDAFIKAYKDIRPASQVISLTVP